MSSPASIAANRANARLSTGPRTPDGKAASRYNALKHGLFARDVVLPGEDRGAYEGDLAELTEAFEPLGRYERALVRRLADIWWRLGRSAAIWAGEGMGVSLSTEKRNLYQINRIKVNIFLSDEICGIEKVAVRGIDK